MIKSRSKMLSVAVVLTLLLTTLLSGCGASQTATSGTTAVAAKTTINFIHWRPEDVPEFNKLIAQFEQENPNIKVQMTTIPSANYIANLQSMVLSGQGADVFTSFPGAQFEALNKANAYVDLSSLAGLSNVDSSLIKMGQKEGKQLAIAYQLVFNDPIYNKDIFDKYNLQVPKDWPGFLNVLKTLKDNGVTPISFCGPVSPNQLVNSLIMNTAPNEDIFQQVMDGKAKLTDPWFVKALQAFKDITPYLEPGALGVTQDGASALFGQGKAAILALGSYQMATIKKQSPDIKQGLMVPMLVSGSEATWDGIFTSTFMLGVNSKSTHIDAAKKFTDFLLQPKVAEDYANATGQMVTVKGVKYSTPELQAGLDFQNTHKKLRFQPIYTIPSQPVTDAVKASIQQVIGGTDPMKAATQAQGVVDKERSK